MDMVGTKIEMNIKPSCSYYNKWKHSKRELYKGRYIYFILLPVILYYIIFHYVPMYGVILAFKSYIPMKGIFNSPWIGFKNFIDFFNSYYFWRLIRNTLTLSFGCLLFGFPAPIILALILNEVNNKLFKRFTQTISYLPHFVSVVIIVGLMMDFLSLNGLFNHILVWMGGSPIQFMSKSAYFRPIFIISNIWESVGWGAIIYLAALSGIDTELYEAAKIDGAGKWKQTLYVTLPGIAPTIIILFILRIGHLMSVGFEKVLLMQNSLNMETSDIIATFVYRRGLLEFNFSFSTAVGLFNSVINFTLLIMANKMSRKLTDSSLW